MLILLLAGCSASGRHVLGPADSATESLDGSRVVRELEAEFGGVVHDGTAQARLNRALATVLPCVVTQAPGAYRVELLSSDRVNAISLPGGRLYLTRGLYARMTEDDLIVAALAHELAHGIRQDHYKPRCGSQDESLQREIQADALGRDLLQQSGVRCDAMTDVIRVISDVQPSGWADRRIRQLEKEKLPSRPISLVHAEARSFR